MFKAISEKMLQKTLFILITAFLAAGCAYYNTFYNAEQYFKKGIAAREKNKTEKLSAQEVQNFDKAIEKSFKVLSDFPDSKYVDDAIFLIGQSYFYKREYSPALKRFEEIVYNFPGSPYVDESRLWIARCLFKMNNFNQAAVELRNSIKSNRDKKQLSGIHYLLAEMFLENGAYDSALVHMQKVLDVSWDDEEKAQTVYRIAEIYLKRGNYEKASDYLKKIYRYNVTADLREKVQVLYAKIYASSSNYEEARRLIQKMLADEKNKDVWATLELELAKLYESEGNYIRALNRYKSITENYPRTPESAESYYRMGMIHIYNQLDYEAAKEEFKKVPSEYRDSPYVLESRQRQKEIERYLSLKSEISTIEEKLRQIEEIDKQGISDSLTTDSLTTDENVMENLSRLRQAFELKSQLEASNQDTAKMYRDYYEKLYQLGELLYFNLNQPDSAIMTIQKLTEDLKYNLYQPQALYMLQYIHSSRQDTFLANLVKSNLLKKYPESPFARIISDSVLNDSPQIQAPESLYYKAEMNMHINPALSLSILDSVITRFPDEVSLVEKSCYTKAFIYDDILLDTTMARLTYEKFLEEYPGSGLAGIVSQRLDFLKNLHSPSPDSVRQDAVDKEPAQETEENEPPEPEPR